MTDFAKRYGPWAVVAGASDGVGSAFAAAVAERGVNVVLLARRRAVLDDVAGQIRADSGVEVRAVPVDLAAPDAMATIADATKDVDVGLLMYCAGADPKIEPFLSSPVDVALGMVHRNCVVPTEMCHHFGASMAQRGRGGVILVGSAAGFAGSANIAVYGATKAFDMVLGEGLWAELHPHGVDVLSLVLGETDTPAQRRTLEERGRKLAADVPLPGAATVDEVVRDAIEQLAHGPTRMVGEQVRAAARFFGGMERIDAVTAMTQASAATMAADPPVQP